MEVTYDAAPLRMLCVPKSEGCNPHKASAFAMTGVLKAEYRTFENLLL